jgi:hypothetical protein
VAVPPETAVYVVTLHGRISGHHIL